MVEKKKIKNCSPTIVNGDTLMSGDGDFITMEVYKKNCSKDCKMKSVCGRVIELLRTNNLKLAMETFKNWKNET